MKKIIFALVCFLFLQNAGICQNPYYDALKLREAIKLDVNHNNKMDFSIFKEDGKLDTVVLENIAGILKHYYPDLKDLSAKDFATKLSTDSLKSFNPFLKDLLIQIKEMGSGKFDLSSKYSAAISSLGSLNVTNIADGIAQFLIKRGKEELNVAFFNRMKKFLDDDKHPEAKTLFPITLEFLSSIETYRYAELIQSLREAFHKDLSNLVIGLNQLIDLPKYKKALKDLPEIRAAVRISKIVSELSQSEEGIYPDSLIHSLALLPDLQDINSNLGNSLKLVDIFSQAIREVDTSKGRRWIKLSDLNALVNDKITLQIFIGLIYQQIKEKDIQFNSTRMDKFMDDNVNTIFVISGLIENFALLASDVDRTIKDFKDKRDKAILSNDDYYSYISKAINIVEYGFKVANTIKADVVNDQYIIVARNANELYKNIYTKNYNNAVMNAYQILNQVFNKLQDDTSLSLTLKEELKRIGIASETIEKILKYGNFMASVVKAESGEEVEQALEAAALPAGSYSIKQKSEYNISVNGYIGYGFDFNGGLYARGVYAPVGISFNAGTRKKYGSTFSIFASLIDVGSVATYRLENGNTGNLKQEIRLESIFSPSAQLFIEPVRGFPLVIGGGWKRTAKLFYSDNTSFTVIAPKDVINLSVLIDIPFFNLVNKPFAKK